MNQINPSSPREANAKAKDRSFAAVLSAIAGFAILIGFGFREFGQRMNHLRAEVEDLRGRVTELEKRLDEKGSHPK